MKTDQELVSMALSMLDTAYAPYSGFSVGAALEAVDGSLYTGCNVENAAYGSSICAERTAVLKAVSEGGRRFRRIAIAGSGKDHCWPCGACRQVLSEFAPNLTVLVSNCDGDFVSTTLDALLPHSFGSTNLAGADLCE